MSRQSSGDVGFTQAVNISPTNRPLAEANKKAAETTNAEGIQMVVLSKDTKDCSNGAAGVVIAAADVEHHYNGSADANGTCNRTKVQVSHV